MITDKGSRIECGRENMPAGECLSCGFMDREPYIRLGQLLIITSNLGFPLVVRAEYGNHVPRGNQIGWMCIHGTLRGRWISMDREKAARGQVLRDGDKVKNGARVFLVRGGELI